MKICPQCRAHYPTHFYVCPQDGKALDSVSGFPAGTVIREKYEILQKLGQGGMGTVYKARHLVFNETCALKVVSSQLAEDPEFLQRFRSEAVIMRRLNHPNAVHVIDIDKTEDDRPFIVMEYVAGENLRELLARRGALPVPEALEIARQVCSALTAAHELNVLHRDIKPDNILIVSLSEGNPLIKVADFGVAKIKESTAQYGLQEGVATRAGVVLGTPAYMSPEQALGKPGFQLDARTDLYSLGVVLYEMLTGAQPFTADTPMGIMLHHMQTVPRPPHELTPGHNIPGPVSALVMKALEKDPANRFSTTAEMQIALATAGEVGTAAPTVPYSPGAPAPVVTPIPSPPSPSSSLTPPPEIPKSVSTTTSPEMTPPTAPQEPKRAHWPVAAGAALMLAIIVVAGWYSLGRRPTQPVQPSQRDRPSASRPAPEKQKAKQRQTEPQRTQQPPDEPAASQPQAQPPQPASPPTVNYRLERTLTGHGDYVWSVAFSPGGTLLASGEGWSSLHFREHAIKLWDAQSGRLLRTLIGDDRWSSPVAFSPSGQYLASGSWDKTIKLWDVSSGRLLRTLTGHDKRVTSVAFSPDGRLLASGSLDKTIKLWEVSTGRELRTLTGHGNIVSSVIFSPDGRLLASGSYDNTVKLWDPQSGRLLRTLKGHNDAIRSLAFNPDGIFLASGSNDKSIKLWNPKSGRLVRTLAGHNGLVVSIAFSPNGQLLAGSDDNTVKLWDPKSGRLVRTLTGHRREVLSVAFSPDGQLFASGSSDMTIKLWRRVEE